MNRTADLLDIGIRRLGSNRVHRARVPRSVMYDAVTLGHPVTALIAPVVARCGVTLRGNLIEIPAKYLSDESQRKYQCPHCLLALVSGEARR